MLPSPLASKKTEPTRGAVDLEESKQDSQSVLPQPRWLGKKGKKASASTRSELHSSLLKEFLPDPSKTVAFHHGEPLRDRSGSRRTSLDHANEKIQGGKETA